MELPVEERCLETEDLEQGSSSETLIKEMVLSHTVLFGDVKRKAYRFDGMGNYFTKEWDLTDCRGREFSWYHVELPKPQGGNQKLALSAQLLIGVLCPPLKLQDILSLVSNGPFCAHVDGALVFRVNSPGPAASKFTLRLAARVTENSVITVSLGRVPRLGFSPTEEADNPVPRTISNLLVHIIDTYMDHLQDIVTELEMELDTVELDLDKGGFALKKEMLDSRRVPKMHLNLQRLLQVVAHGEQVFPRVKEKCATKDNRVTAIQAGLDSWQSEQINRKLYYLSILSVIFLPLSIITGIFGMNVGGVPWTGQTDPALKDGFRNVLYICAVMVVLLLLFFTFPNIYTRISAWRQRISLRRARATGTTDFEWILQGILFNRAPLES
ncbi:hypothetical protein MRB53_007263 [Persea americana]|uniref:Uncharacterized protein n=1 Tax=Persea americana TaxID=3435 RepID=A0ACC2MJC9_PERAE|nr:hypothetical protein MRB53_007263 [Persea americana]